MEKFQFNVLGSLLKAYVVKATKLCNVCNVIPSGKPFYLLAIYNSNPSCVSIITRAQNPKPTLEHIRYIGIKSIDIGLNRVVAALIPQNTRFQILYKLGTIIRISQASNGLSTRDLTHALHTTVLALILWGSQGNIWSSMKSFTAHRRLFPKSPQRPLGIMTLMITRGRVCVWIPRDQKARDYPDMPRRHVADGRGSTHPSASAVPI